MNEYTVRDSYLNEHKDSYSFAEWLDDYNEALKLAKELEKSEEFKTVIIEEVKTVYEWETKVIKERV